MNPLRLFSFFHLNLMFSSIEEESRSEVIARCYWPLLHMAKNLNVPLGIELTGYTLETIRTIDPAWVNLFRALLHEKRIELIGSGYAQIIGPLVPAAVNQANQKLGMDVYDELLAIKPRLALVNEQAWSGGVVEHYLAAGYAGVIMEWDNPAADHPEWSSELRYAPQRVAGADGRTIPVIWNQSIAFQRFQRYAHEELELDELIADIAQRVADHPRSWALYGNDAEIFNFRPGRFHTETTIASDEWDRIEALFQALLTDSRFSLILPSTVLNDLTKEHAPAPLRLESTTQPIPVKKQAKYNITRWAVTGRDDLDLNTRCHRLLTTFDKETSEEEWKELCYLWSSDLRTHLTQKRWASMQSRLASIERRRNITSRNEPLLPFADLSSHSSTIFKIEQSSRRIKVTTPALRAHFLPLRGLALEALYLGEGQQSMAGTLHHGFFDHIGYGSDFYTGHLVMERPGQHKITDLNPVSAEVGEDSSGWLCIACSQSTPVGVLNKLWRLAPDIPEMELTYQLIWPGAPKGALRLGHLTLHPAAFAQASLSVRTLNGGAVTEQFPFSNDSIDHLAPVSTLITASHGFGMTEGWLDIGDGHRRIRIETDAASACVTGHLQFSTVPPGYFCRLAFSLQELDDTYSDEIGRHSLDHRVARFRFRVLEID